LIVFPKKAGKAKKGDSSVSTPHTRFSAFANPIP
jgi:hypothetical protein